MCNFNSRKMYGIFCSIIKNGISDGISNALGKSVSKVVEDKVTPTIYKKTNEVADVTVESINVNADLYKENLDEINKATAEMRESIDELNSKNNEETINK